jgi:periplasmic divalent cation tolerance protein
MSNLVIVLTTMPDGEKIDELARALVRERLAACVNVHASMTSIYRWKAEIERERERQIVIKTTRDRVGALQARLHELHPYELPEFLVVGVEAGSDAYVKWVATETSRE